MQPWIETTLSELERAALAASAQFDQADAKHTHAEDELEAARDHLYRVNKALEAFTVFANMQPEGGVW